MPGHPSSAILGLRYQPLSGFPFGGDEVSGFGSEGDTWGVHEFVRPKNVFVAL